VAAAILAAVAAQVAGGGRAVHAQATVDSDLLSLLNQDRAANGLGPLAWNGQLGGIGESSSYSGCGFAVGGRAQDMIQRNYFAHPILNCGGQNVFNILNADGIRYSAAGENIGWMSQYGDPATAARYLEQQFMASPEHRANILSGSYNVVGIGSWVAAPGQTWSGGGSAQSNVVVVAEEFAAVPNPGVVPAVRPAAPPPAPRAATPALARPAPTAAPTPAPTPVPTAAPALPETGVVGMTAPPARLVAHAAPLPAPEHSPALPLGGAIVVLGLGAWRRFAIRG